MCGGWIGMVDVIAVRSTNGGAFSFYDVSIRTINPENDRTTLGP
jgi:hypothetical protein